MLYSAEFDGIHGYVNINLMDLGDGTERVRLEHRITSDQAQANAGVAIPKTYLPKRIAGMVFPTRIIEYVDVPKGRIIPCDVANALARKHLGDRISVEWAGRGWHIYQA